MRDVIQWFMDGVPSMLWNAAQNGVLLGVGAAWGGLAIGGVHAPSYGIGLAGFGASLLVYALIDVASAVVAVVNGLPLYGDEDGDCA